MLKTTLTRAKLGRKVDGKIIEVKASCTAATPVHTWSFNAAYPNRMQRRRRHERQLNLTNDTIKISALELVAVQCAFSRSLDCFRNVAKHLFLGYFFCLPKGSFEWKHLSRSIINSGKDSRFVYCLEAFTWVIHFHIPNSGGHLKFVVPSGPRHHYFLNLAEEWTGMNRLRFIVLLNNCPEHF